MRYNGISNDSERRADVTPPFVWWDGAFSEEALVKIIEAHQSEPGVDTIVFSTSSEPTLEKLRTDNKWIFERLNHVITEVNNNFYGFDINGYDSYEYIEQIPSTPSVWSVDLQYGEHFANPPPNKLTAVLLLNKPEEFEGGALQINTIGENDPVSTFSILGRVLVYPSWQLTRIAPVISGVRKSIKIKVTGPKFV